jgi:hypothetical protein
MDSAFDIIFAHGNYEIASCKIDKFILDNADRSDVVCLDVGTRLFASQPIQWQSIHSKYSILRPVASSGMNMFLSIRKSVNSIRLLTMQLYSTRKTSRLTRRRILLGTCKVAS